MTIIDLKALVEVTRKIAEARPDHVYEQFEYLPPGDDHPYMTCLYVRNGEPDCLIGHGLVALGVDPASIEGPEFDAIGSMWEHPESVPMIEWDNEGELDSDGVPPEINWLAIAQSAQDDGYSWGDAIKIADRGGDRSAFLREVARTPNAATNMVIR
jgi:hypothetical protein